MATHKLEKKIIIKGHIVAETGIMVGGSTSALEIGGTDKQVVRNPINKMPYIPGSSLKGKMRSMFELSEGTISASDDGKSYGPTLNADHLAAQLFGFIKDRTTKSDKQQPSRLIVRDGELENWKEFDGRTELLYTEVKAENSIDRITSAANPRFFERVPKGAKFGLNMTINVFNTDVNGSKFLASVWQAMRLVQDDYLGGGGSRGNGQIRFVVTDVLERSADYYKGVSGSEKQLNSEIPEEFKAKA